MINILCVCSVGVGSSLMLKMNAEKVLKNNGYKDFHVENTNVAGAGGMDVDVLITTPDVFDQIHGCKSKQTVLMDNMVSKKELNEKLTKAVEEL